jgi:hypothetical protein
MFMEHAERADEAMDVIAADGGPAGLVTAALPGAAGVRAEACERGSEPTRQSRGTAMHPRTLQVLTMTGAGGGRRISDVLLAQGRQVPDTHCAVMPDLPGYRGPDTPFPSTLTLPPRRTGHAPAACPDGRGVRVRHSAEVTAAGQSADEARVQVNGAWHAARYLAGADGAHSMARKAAGIGFGADSPSWLARTSNTGRRDAASLAWNWLPPAPAARTRMPRTASRSSRPSTEVSPTRKEVIMTATTEGTSRTAHLLTLMKRGDDAFNARDFAAVDQVHHPDMIAYITGLAEPVYGKEAHAAAMQQLLRIFPDIHVYSDPYPIQFGSGDWITVVTNATGTFTGEMTLPDGTAIPPTGKAFDVEFAQTTKWDGDQLIVISAFFDAALQRRQIGLA